MSDSKNRNKILLAGFLVLVIVLGGYFLGVKPQQEERADVLDELSTVEQRNSQLQSEVNRLRGQEQELPQVREKIAALQVGIPNQMKLNEYVDAVIQIAAEHEVFIGNIGFQEPEPPTIVGEVPVPGAGGSTPSPTPTNTSAAAPTPDPSATDEPAAPPASSTNSDSIPGFFSMSLVIEFVGPPANVTLAVADLQTKIPRHAYIHNVLYETIEKAEVASGGYPALSAGWVKGHIGGLLYLYDIPTQPEPTEPVEPTPLPPMPTLPPGKNPFQPYGVS